jgi:hypothetical protein
MLDSMRDSHGRNGCSALLGLAVLVGLAGHFAIALQDYDDDQ